jgi:hypothetical protein
MCINYCRYFLPADPVALQKKKETALPHVVEETVILSFLVCTVSRKK